MHRLRCTRCVHLVGRDDWLVRFMRCRFDRWELWESRFGVTRGVCRLRRAWGNECRHQNRTGAVGKFKEHAAAGNEEAERRAEAAQALQPDRTVWRQHAREPGDLAPM